MKKIINGVMANLTAAEETEVNRQRQPTLKGKTARLSRLRREKINAGIRFDGMDVPTDKEAQAALTIVYNAVQQTTTRVIHFKTNRGFVVLNKAQVEALFSAVVDHVQACFTREKEIIALLDNDLTIDLEAIW